MSFKYLICVDFQRTRWSKEYSIKEVSEIIGKFYLVFFVKNG